ncbi:MAG: sulfoxide reductase heme-binding subunit YedZ [Anaerolineales bacterium]|nr:sulfoxide reductase heme-binding subunit YedZ [Anaerolineales bacterium]
MPLGLLLWDWLRDNLTVNPIQDATARTGKPALVLLVLTLAVTPLNTAFGLGRLIPLRRWLGLYAGLYAALHFMVFIGLDYGFNIDLLREAIFEKRFALVGFAAGTILLPLAITSTKGWMRRLKRGWKRLHRLVYLAAILAVVHYVWLVKSDIREPLFYGLVVLILLGLRIPPLRRAVSRLRRLRKWMSLELQSRFRGQQEIHPTP